MTDFLSENWLLLAVSAYAAASECLPFMRKVEANGAAHFLFLFVGKLLGRKK